jgi:hypothetical protein
MESTTGRPGRRSGTFGSYPLSGIVFCKHCGGIMECAGGTPDYYLRCRNNGKQGKLKCTNRINVKIGIVTDAIVYILEQMITPMYESCVELFNEELNNSSKELIANLNRKTHEYGELLKKRDAIIELFSKAKQQGLGEKMNTYPTLAAKIEDQINKVQFEIDEITKVKQLLLEPLVLDKKLLQNELINLRQMMYESNHVSQKRDAIKKLVSKILLDAQRDDKGVLTLTLTLPEIPTGLEHVLRNSYTFLPQKKKNEDHCNPFDKSIFLQWMSNKDCIVQRSTLQNLYDNLSNTYELDKLSYKKKPAIPVYIEAVISTRKNSGLREFGGVGCLTSIFRKTDC